MRSMYGRTTSGASVWPTKTLAATAIDSAPETPIRKVIALAIRHTSTCMTPRW